MIIVNQDKTEIINFDRLTEIAVCGKTITVTDGIQQVKGLEIAKYATEERAKEVLQEIILAKPFFEKANTIVDPMVRARLLIEMKYNYWDTYEMPAE